MEIWKTGSSGWMNDGNERVEIPVVWKYPHTVRATRDEHLNATVLLERETETDVHDE